MRSAAPRRPAAPASAARPRPSRPPRRPSPPWLAALLCLLAALPPGAGCVRYNTYYNAAKAFNQAERERQEALKLGRDVTQPTTNQKKSYERAIQKAQKVLDEYPGSGLTDDALFLMAKSYHRLGSYRMSIGKIDLLFVNYPATPFEEEALYLQALNHLYIQDVLGSNGWIERLQAKYPRSRYRAEASRVRADNAFTLQEWEAARDYCREYLAQYAEGSDRDAIGLKLGQSLFELKDWAGAAAALREVLARAPKGETEFRARLLLARALAAQGEAAAADQEIALLKPESELYSAQGEVALAEGENLLAQGKDAEAAPLLENLPPEWLKTPAVKARVADLLGRVYYRQWKLEDANKQFLDAKRSPTALSDPDGTLKLQSNLRDYLAAEQGLKNARDDSAVAYFKLTQANALLFGFDRPRLALDLYREVAASAGADSSTRARGLYGAALVLRDRLGQPDSAAAFFAVLQSDFPRTPQAFASRDTAPAGLFAFLRAQYESERRRQAAAGGDTGAGGRGEDRGAEAEGEAGSALPESARGVVAAGRAVTAAADSAAAPPSGAPLPDGAPPDQPPPGGAAPHETSPAEPPAAAPPPPPGSPAGLELHEARPDSGEGAR